MLFFSIFAAYVAVVTVLLFIALFGSNPIFEGTIVARAHHFVTGGWFPLAKDAVQFTCGDRAADAITAVENYCCNTRNPILPALYNALVAACYWLFDRHVFSKLPTPYTPEWHRITGSASVVLCLVCWAFACFADPGRIDQSNAAAWNISHPPGDGLFSVKQCGTCNIARPARSKHCSLCGFCIARHDHHCGWINNCVGAGNLRWFIAFLASNALMMAYGGILALATLYGVLETNGVLDWKLYDRKSGVITTYRAKPWKLYRLVAYRHSVMLALALFLVLAALILSAFMLYHVWNVSVGLTGSERYRVSRAHRRAAMQPLSAPQEQQPDATPGDTCNTATAKPAARRYRVNYSKGFWRNWYELVYPPSITRVATHGKQD